MTNSCASQSKQFRDLTAALTASSSDAVYEDKQLQTIAVLDRSLDVLGKMNSAGSKSLLQAIATTVGHDGKVTAAEADLLRTICASLNCPLPPILGLVTAA